MPGGIKTNSITNANVYLDGGTLLGQAEEIKLPEVKVKTVERKALGMVAGIKLPTGIEALEGEIKFNSFYPEAMRKAANPFQSVSLQCRANVETFTSQGRAEQRPLVVFLTVNFTEFPLGNFKQNEPGEFAVKFTATYVKVVEDGKTVMELDCMANLYEVDGVDLLADYRTNIGG